MRVYVCLIFSFAFLFSCQKEEFILEETEDNEGFVLDTELSRLFTYVAAHDGSFDDVLDAAGCFSVQFPYTIRYEGELVTINSVNDLLGIEEGADVVYQFPITVTFSDYVNATLNSPQELDAARTSCESNTAFLNSISCVDFVYPIKIALFNAQINRFITLTINHDQENFIEVSKILNNAVAEISSPVTVSLENGSMLTIDSTTNLKTVLYQNSGSCE